KRCQSTLSIVYLFLQLHLHAHAFATRRSSDLIFPAVLSSQSIRRNPAASQAINPRRSTLNPRHSTFDTGHGGADLAQELGIVLGDRKSTRLNSSHVSISYAVFCLTNKSHTRRC